MHELGTRGVWFICTVALLQGCSEDSPPAGPAAGGTSGGSGKGGSSAGGSAARAGSSGRPNAAGRGGSAGTEGGRDGGSGEAGGDGGDAGDVNGSGHPDEPFPIASDDSCRCTAVQLNAHTYDFSCRQSLDAYTTPVAPGSLCSYPGPAVARSTCTDGSFLYSWSEGDENVYELELDRDGHTLYYSASGYVEGCGVNEDGNNVGTIVAGELSTHCSPTTACNPCGNDGGIPGTLPLCVDCGDDPTAEHVSLSLSDYCAQFECPKDPASVPVGTCSEPHAATLREGCGFVAVHSFIGLSSATYYFDTAGTLVGAQVTNDVPFGQCHVPSYDGGEIPELCATARECDLCEGGGAGAAGEGGGAGAAGASGLCMPR